MGKDNITNMNQDYSVLKSLKQFNGFYTNVYRDPFVSGNAFVFITKPLLFIEPIRPSVKDNKKQLAYMNMTRDPMFTQFLKDEQLNDADGEIVNMLSYNNELFNSMFLPMFTNECKSVDTNDVSIEQTEAFETKQGYRQNLPSFKTPSESSNQISISVTEDNNLSFTKLLTLWVNYMSNIADGTFDANPDMILEGALDYTCSIYYFVLEPDGRTLKYWCKYTGCWPTNIPYSTLGYNKGSNESPEITVQFQYMVKEDMNPKILEDFNIVSLKLQDSGTRYAYEIQNQYASITRSPFLNREIMLEIIPNAEVILKSEERDPLIFYRGKSTSGIASDATKARFELVFDDNGYKSNFLNDVLESDGLSYFIRDVGTTEYAKTGNEPTSWDTTQFWNE